MISKKRAILFGEQIYNCNFAQSDKAESHRGSVIMLEVCNTHSPFISADISAKTGDPFLSS